MEGGASAGRCGVTGPEKKGAEGTAEAPERGELQGRPQTKQLKSTSLGLQQAISYVKKKCWKQCYSEEALTYLQVKDHNVHNLFSNV